MTEPIFARLEHDLERFGGRVIHGITGHVLPPGYHPSITPAGGPVSITTVAADLDRGVAELKAIADAVDGSKSISVLLSLTDLPAPVDAALSVALPAVVDALKSAHQAGSLPAPPAG